MDETLRKVARRFAGSSEPFARLIAAVERAEGNIVKAVQCTYPEVKTREEALEITCRSAAHALADYAAKVGPRPFVDFWAERWAPQGAKNDPTGLNKNWPLNVKKFWLNA